MNEYDKKVCEAFFKGIEDAYARKENLTHEMHSGSAGLTREGKAYVAGINVAMQEMLEGKQDD